MRLSSGPRWTIAFVLASALALSASGGKNDKKDKAAPDVAKTVDSGAFGVFVKGRRVVTESFSVELRNGISIVKSQLREAPGAEPVKQKSDLEFTSSGELLRYEWNDAGSSISVLPNNDFLIEKITTAASAKAAEQPFLMPSSSMMLDNNFFVHREVLVWRYLAADCKSEGGGLKCQQGPVEFGVLVPQEHASMRVRMELIGKEKVTIRGTERDLLRLNFSGENFQWSLWVDDQDQFKLMRVAIPADDIEVVRD